MLEKIRSNPQLSHFILYFATFGLYGFVIAVPGPVVPFMAEKYGLPQTDFIFMFWCRAGGFIVGGMLTKVLTKYASYHRLIFISMVIVAFFFMLFPFTFSLFFQGLQVFLAAVSCCTFQIILIMCFMEAFKGNEEQYWIQISMVSFGICALVCPIVVGFTGEMGYFVIGVCFLCLSLFYLILLTPEKILHFHLAEDHEREQRIINISKATEIGLSLMIFFYFAEETGFAGWISSYSVMKGAFEKEGSAFLVSLYWTTITVFRLIFANMSGKNAQKIILLFKLRGIAFVISIILIVFGFTAQALIVGCILTGIGFSATYALVFTLPLQFKRKLQPSHTANITIFGTVGEGLFTTIQGYCMRFIGPDTFFPFLACLSLLNFFTAKFTIKSLQQKSSQPLLTQEFEMTPQKIN